MFILVNLFFVLVPQVFACLLIQAIPMVYACGIVEGFFILAELIFSGVVCVISQKNNALFELRSSQMIRHRNKSQKIKSSKEIEEELYAKFPKLKKN